MENNTETLIRFLRELATDMENHRLSVNQIFDVSQLYMKTRFEQSGDDDPTEEDTYKYLFTGWYIHQQIESIAEQNPQMDM